jgi:hypothetical protein
VSLPLLQIGVAQAKVVGMAPVGAGPATFENVVVSRQWARRTAAKTNDAMLPHTGITFHFGTGGLPACELIDALCKLEINFKRQPEGMLKTKKAWRLSRSGPFETWCRWFNLR